MACGEVKISRGEVGQRLEAYLAECGEKEGAFPNLAGYCRFCGFGLEGFAELRRRWPDLGDYVLAVLEDSALTIEKPAALVSLYLKRRLGYDEVPGGEADGEVIFVDRALVRDGE